MIPQYQYLENIPLDDTVIANEMAAIECHRKELRAYIRHTRLARQRNLAKKALSASDIRLMGLRFIRDEMLPGSSAPQ